MESLLKWQYVDKYTRRFLQTMYAEGIMDQLTQKNPRLAEIGDAYFNQGRSTNLISRLYSIVPERIRQLKDKYIIDLHKLGDDYLQNLYPLDWISKAVKNTPELRLKRASDRDSETAQIADMIKQGASRQDIINTLGIDPAKLSAKYPVLDNWGIDISAIRKNANIKALLEEIQNEKNPDRLRELFSQVTRRAYVAGVTGENPVLIAVSRIARGAGFRFRWLPEKFITTIDNEELREDQVVPVGYLRHKVFRGKQKERSRYFIKTDLTERAQQLWLTEPELRKYL